MNNLTKAALFSAVASVALNTEANAASGDNRPQNIPGMTDQIPNASVGRSAGNGWKYVMNNGQYVVDEGRDGECPAVLITKHGVDKNGQVASLFSLKSLPYGTEIHLDDMHEVNLDTGRAVVNGDRKYDYTGNTLSVDSQFIGAGVIPGDVDYIDLKTPHPDCKVTKGPDNTVTVEEPDYGGGCGATDCHNGGGQVENPPGQPSNPGGNPLPIAYNVGTPSPEVKPLAPWVVVAKPAPIFNI